MLKRSVAILGLLLFATMSIANDVPASDASIREFLEITNARSLIGTMRGQMDNMIQTQMRSALQGKPMTPEVKAILDRMQQRTIEATNEMLTWETLEPIYFRMFGNSFSQDEMDRIIALYKTPTGQLLIKKMPLVLKNVMDEMPAMMKPMIEKIQAIQADAVREIQALPKPNNETKKPD